MLPVEEEIKERIALELFYKNMTGYIDGEGIEERELVFEWSRDPMLRLFWLTQVNLVLEQLEKYS